MIHLLSGATKTLAATKDRSHMGILRTPRQRNSIGIIASMGLPWACDNDAFKAWNEEQFRRMIHSLGLNPGQRGLLWVNAPDVVADAKATQDRFWTWQPILAERGIPIAFAGQNGAEDLDLPWRYFHCLFIGGDDEWKLSKAAEDLAREAKAQNKLVHMGRVNSLKRIRHAHEIGCDSFDGTMTSKWPDKRLPQVLRWTKQTTDQKTLF